MAEAEPPREVVITGIGVVSPLGLGQGRRSDCDFWQGLLRGDSGVRRLRRRAVGHLPVQIGAEIPEFDAKPWVRPRKSLKVMSREIQTAAVAAALAMEDAFPDQVRDGAREGTSCWVPERAGVVLGAEMLYADLAELAGVYQACTSEGQFQMSRFGAQFMQQVYPLWLLRYLPNMSACHLSIGHDAQGPCNTIVAGDVSGLLAILEGARVIERGGADVMLTGGSGSRLIVTPSVYRGDMRLSHHNDHPEQASRPFDRERDGMVNGEGAAVLVLESRAHAMARGATILATFLGGCATYVSPQRAGGPQQVIRQAIEGCLAQIGHDHQQPVGHDPARHDIARHDVVGHYNAHGVSTQVDDAIEAQALSHILPNVPVIAPKANFGNLGAGSGAVELAVSCMAQFHGELPPHPTYETPDPACPVHVVQARTPIARRPWLKLGWAPAGQAVCLAWGLP